MKKNGWAAVIRRKQYVLAGALVVVAAVATTVVYSNKQESEREQIEAELAEEMNAERQNAQELAREEPSEEAAEASSLIPPETEETEMAELASEAAGEEIAEETTDGQAGETEKPAATETAATRGKLSFSPEKGMNWPLEGNVILNYSMDATIYFPTLDQYKYNPAVVIAGEVNSKVYSVAKGRVTSIKNDEVTGCTMSVDLGSGYQAIYGQLKELNFEEGDYVEAGHVLGYVSQPTKYFAVEGSNLYFELQKDGNPVNPVEFFE